MIISGQIPRPAPPLKIASPARCGHAADDTKYRVQIMAYFTSLICNYVCRGADLYAISQAIRRPTYYI
jgi:hypothetical protein